MIAGRDAVVAQAKVELFKAVGGRGYGFFRNHTVQALRRVYALDRYRLREAIL